MDALHLFREEKLREAIAAATGAVQGRPAAAEPRDLLSQLLCFAGEWERADKQLETLAMQFPDREAVVSLIRQLIRAATSREQFFDCGRLPEFLETPPDYAQHALQASICLREGDTEEALRLIGQAEAARPRMGGKCDGQPFRDLRDADDLTASVLEVFTTTGKYYWIPLEGVHRIQFQAVETPLDVLWRRCQIQATAFTDGIAYVPQLYSGTFRATDDSLRVGRGTDWLGPEDGPVRGVGHRIFMVDNAPRPIVEIQCLEFEEVVRTAEAPSQPV